MLSELLALLERIPSAFVYLALGLGAAIENVFPALPADTFVALGGLLSAVGTLEARWIFLWTWLFNVGSALATYRIGYTHGRPFFEHGWGRRLLRPHQVERMTAFYDRFGTWAIFFTRFLPGLRSVVPVFAGVSRQPALFVAVPLAVASGIWYGALILLGAFAGRNLARLEELLGELNFVLVVVAAVLGAAVGVWWWRTRHGHHE